MLTSIMPFYESSKMYWGGKSIDIDNSNEISESDISNLIEKGCEKEWILHPSLEKEYDFILLGKNQKGITVINK